MGGSRGYGGSRGGGIEDEDGGGGGEEGLMWRGQDGEEGAGFSELGD